MGKLEGKIAVITGAANGIGRACATGFVREGAKVVIGDLDDSAAASLVSELGDSAHYQRCDVTREADVEALVACAEKHFGGLDIMFNNAGAVGARGSLMEISEADFDATMNLPSGVSIDSEVASLGTYTAPNWTIVLLPSGATETRLAWRTVKVSVPLTWSE